MDKKDIIRALKDKEFYKTLNVEQLSQLPNISVRALTQEELNNVTGGNGATHARPLTGISMNRKRLTGFYGDTQSTNSESNQMRPRTGMFGGA